MAEYVVVDKTKLEADLTIVADSIRAKSGATEEMAFPSGFKSVVETIDTSKEEQEKSVTITENGTTEVIPDSGKVLSKVTVNVDVESGGGDSYYDTFWDSFQNNGNRRRYQRAFDCQLERVWTKESFKPKYDIIVGNGNMVNVDVSNMFAHCTFLEDFVGLLDELGIKLELNLYGNKTYPMQSSATYMFAGCSNMTTCPPLNVKNTQTINGIFSGCKSLKKIELNNIFCDSSTNFDAYFINAFTGMSALEEVVFTGIVGKSFSFAQSPLLKNESIQGLIDVMEDLTGKTAQTITLHADVKAKLAEEQIATITSKNWTLA